MPAAPPGLELEREIGRGGMGRVFLARHLRLDRAVAVKFLPPDLALDPSFEARFEREARALARLSHAHVVAVHDFGVNADGEPYLVMELALGGTLRDRIPAPLEQAVELVLQVCDGLGYAHSQHIVHRDVKPENVLLDASGRAKLADFGLARLGAGAPESDAVTHPLWVLGTPGYLAPEARDGKAPDPRMDVFAVGVLLHVAITGKLPDRELSELPEALRPIVRRATATDPNQRHADATELGRALGAAGLGASAKPSEQSSAAWLPPDEVSWMRAVALALTGATALALYALLTSVTPRVMRVEETLPMVVFGAEPLSDGRLMTRARFETVPTLAAAAGWAVALGTYGLLRRHWRAAGLERTLPDRPLHGSWRLLALAAVINAIYVGRLVLEHFGAGSAASYAPVIGGVIEMAMLYVFWMTVLEALRVGRALRREPWLWLGLGWSLVPPGTAFIALLAGQKP